MGNLNTVPPTQQPPTLPSKQKLDSNDHIHLFFNFHTVNQLSAPRILDKAKV